MPTSLATPTLEFAALIARSTRLGRLDPYELLESYVALAPATHAGLNNSRQLDLDALVAALGAWPYEFIVAPQVLVVPRLAAFTHTKVSSQGLAAGILQDGTLLLEGRFGLLSLIAVAGSLCAMAHELDKARALNPPSEEELFAHDDAPAESTQVDEFDEPLVRIGSHRYGGEPTPMASQEHALPDVDDARTTESDTGEADERTTVSNSAEADESDTVTSPLDDAITRLAFAWGVDETRLLEADQKCGGRLLAMLAAHWEIPPVLIHADFDTVASSRSAIVRAERIAATLAEMGLLERELHLWVGGSTITDCVSPYTRELHDQLLAWAQTHPHDIGDDLDIAHSSADEDALYALCIDFLASDPRLLDERTEAERTVGILRQQTDSLAFDIIDTARLDPNVIDARLPDWAPKQNAPVVLRVALDLEDTHGIGFTRLIALIAPKLASITLALEATALEHNPGTVLLPSAVVSWAGEQLIQVPSPTTATFTPKSDAFDVQVVAGGSVVSVPTAELLSRDHVALLRQHYGARAITVGGDSLLSASVECVLGGLLAATMPISLAVVAAHYLERGRADLATIRGLSALARNKLSGLGQPPTSGPAPPPAPSKPPTSRRTVRLRV